MLASLKKFNCVRLTNPSMPVWQIPLSQFNCLPVIPDASLPQGWPGRRSSQCRGQPAAPWRSHHWATRPSSTLTATWSITSSLSASSRWPLHFIGRFISLPFLSLGSACTAACTPPLPTVAHCGLSSDSAGLLTPAGARPIGGGDTARPVVRLCVGPCHWPSWGL